MHDFLIQDTALHNLTWSKHEQANCDMIKRNTGASPAASNILKFHNLLDLKPILCVGCSHKRLLECLLAVTCMYTFRHINVDLYCDVAKQL